jgi:aryl-alcohol dehydrogenase-like predicted oxidoreductase
MEQRALGREGLTVSAIGLGAMGLSQGYGPADETQSRVVIRGALDLGVTLLDTAMSYGAGHNEELIGGAIAGRRDEAVLASKFGIVRGPGGVRLDGRPEQVRGYCEASLARLGTDHLDLYYLHRVDPQVPLEESWGALADLVAAGKVRALGLCEVTAAQLDLAQSIYPVASVQSELSLWTRGPLDQIVPWCQAHGALFAAYAPLGRGYLTGSVRSARFEPADIRSANPRFTAEAISGNQPILAVIAEVASRHDATLGQVAIAWTLAQGEHVLPIPGTKRLNYLEENIAAASLPLTDADLASLNAAPPAVGARY